MKSSIHKPFQTIANKPMIRYIIDNCHLISPNVCVVAKDCFKDSILLKDVDVVVQEIPDGSGGAVRCAIDHLRSEYTVILCGDMPLIRREHLEELASQGDDCSIIAMPLADEFEHMAYGRVIVKSGKFQEIVEYKEIPQEERQNLRLANSGVYKIKTPLLKEYIYRITLNEKSQEFFLTDIFKIMKEDGIEVNVLESEDYWAFHGINTMDDLSRAEMIVQDSLRKKFMINGVKLLDPRTVYFSYDTDIENDVVIEPHVFFGPNVKVGKGSRINAFSHLSDCEIMDNVEIGPFARIRGGSTFMAGTSVGNFVEVKGSVFGEKSKAKHLAYIGDTSLGEKVNIGAGTITCNYDGVKKYKTLIGDGTFVGSNSTLVAPVSLGNNVIVGAGSVITKDVSDNSLAISRPDQKEITHGADKIWRKKGKIN